MRKLAAIMIAGMLAATTVGGPAYSAPAWQYGYWHRGPGGHWAWRGGWGPGGAWVRHRGYWAYRWHPAPWRYARWVRGSGGRWGWHGGWGPGGTWVRYRGYWAYRWR